MAVLPGYLQFEESEGQVWFCIISNDECKAFVDDQLIIINDTINEDILISYTILYNIDSESNFLRVCFYAMIISHKLFLFLIYNYCSK